MTSKSPYSRHFFLFPFQWSFHEKPHASDRKKHCLQLAEALDDQFWSKQTYEPGEQFGLHHYFHDFARSTILGNSPNTSVQVFSRNTSGQYILSVKNKGIHRAPENGIARFTLEISRVSLRIYETGVAVFCLQLDNTAYPDKEDVLIINDYGRRLFPQYLDTATGIEGPKQNFLPDSVEIAGFKEDFSRFPSDGNHHAAPVHFLPSYLTGLLGPRFRALDDANQDADVVVENLLDDRMFLVCSLMDESAMSAMLVQDSHGRYGYQRDPFWYAYLFADKDKPTIAHPGMMQALIDASTYTRWLEDRQLYGVSRYSFMALAGAGREWVVSPMTGNYLRLIELCLAQRATVLLFREEATSIARDIARDHAPNQVAKRIRQLYGDYIRFSNQIYFREVSSYEQGIELYDLMQRQMRVQEQVNTLKSELEEMNAYARLISEESRARAFDLIAAFGGVMLIPSFLLSYLGFFDKWKTKWYDHQDKFEWILVICLVVPVIIFLSGILRRKGIWHVVGLLILLGLFVSALVAPFLL
jgi:hypothetical protein